MPEARIKEQEEKKKSLENRLNREKNRTKYLSVRKYKARQTLWDEVEHTEKHPKAQLAYSFDIALQNELSMEENIELARAFVMENFVSRGMIADLCIHDSDKDDNGIRNPHFHVLCPIRPLNKDGTWGSKEYREYLVDEDGNPILDKKGKQKFNSRHTTDWGEPDTLDMWRGNWAELVNKKLAEAREKIKASEYTRPEKSRTVIDYINIAFDERKGIRWQMATAEVWIKQRPQTLTGALQSTLFFQKEI